MHRIRKKRCGSPVTGACRGACAALSGNGCRFLNKQIGIRLRLAVRQYRNLLPDPRLPGEIERLEASIAADEQALHDPDLFTRDPRRFANLTERIARHRGDVEAAELRWLEVAELAERLAGSAA